MNIRNLHVYAQPHWHADAIIAGDRVALTAFRDTLTRMLDGASSPATETLEAFTNDGEGYSLYVHLIETAVFDRVALRYTDEIAAEPEDSSRLQAYELRDMGKRSKPKGSGDG